MNVREIEAKTLLSAARQPDPWFGIKYTMNLYRGCQHRCIYCDSRSECYQIADFDGEVLVKANALALLRRELRSKRVKGYVGTGSMNDPYMPLERQLGLTGRALEIIAELQFPVHVLTKSDLVLRDSDLLAAIEQGAGGASPAAVVSFTITTADDDLARKIEPGAPPPSARFRALAALAARGIATGVLLMPVLPFIEDTPENIRAIMEQAHACGARHVIPAFGMTLRDRLIALAERHPDYALGFQDEVWWSRVTQPYLHAWADGDAALRLVEQTPPKDNPDRKAFACYGLLVSCPAAPATLPEQVWPRFVEDRPISAVTTQYLAWCCTKLAKLDKKALLMIWDNASWHISKEVRTWIRDHNRAVRQQGAGVRILACYLPSKSPCLNRIEPHWMHGKRKVLEPARLLTAQELADRVCAHFGCDHELHLAVTEKAA